MAITRFPPVTLVGPKKTFGHEQSAQEQIENQRQIDAHENARIARANNGGRSAPPSAQSRPYGFTPADQWNARFASTLSPYATGMEAEEARASNPVTNTQSTPQQPDYIHSPVPLNNLAGGSKLPQGTTIADSTSNYRGDKSYFDPYSGNEGARVIEYNPKNDYAGSSGILKKYQTPSTQSTFIGEDGRTHTTGFTPGNVTDAQGNSVSTTGATQPYNQAEARANLYQNYPEIWKAGSPENVAFTAHANQYGEPSAFTNVRDIIGGARGAPQGSGVTTAAPDQTQDAGDTRMQPPKQPAAQSNAGENASKSASNSEGARPRVNAYEDNYD